MKTAVVSEIGARLEMEDAHFIHTNFWDRGWVFGGIYDGHGGAFAAQYAANEFPRLFREKVEEGLDFPDAYTDVYEKISMDLEGQDSGTTAVNFLVLTYQDEGSQVEHPASEIFTANTGDARAIIIGENSVHQVTIDHRIDNPEERERVLKMGAQIRGPYVCKGEMGLMPTRTIGDQYFKSIGVIARPFVNRYVIQQSDLILLAACDGLFDTMTNEEVADVARKQPEPVELVNLLRDEVLVNRLGTDNLTIIAVSLKD